MSSNKNTKAEKTGSDNINKACQEKPLKPQEAQEKAQRPQERTEKPQEPRERTQGPQRKAQGPLENWEGQEKVRKRTKEVWETPEGTGSVAPEAGFEKTGEGEKAEKKSGGRVKWVILGAALILVLLLSAGYTGAAMYYRAHFLPGTSVNGIECGNMTAEEAAALVDRQIDTYCLQVWGRHHATGESDTLVGEVLPEDISLSYVDSLGGVESLLAEQDEWSWPMACMGRFSYGHSLVQGVRFDEDKLKAAVNSWTVCQKKNMLEPKDAYISDYKDEINGYEVIPETISTALDMERVINCISDAIYAKQTALDLEQELCYIEAEITRDDAVLRDYAETANTWLGTKITYDWNGSEVVLGLETLKEWVVMEESGPVLDEEAVKAFVKAQAKKYNTYGRKKRFVTALGIELTLDSPNYGWKTDTEAETEELIQLIYQGSVTEREPVYSVTAREKGSGAEDIGGDYIEADLTHQHLYVYQNGQVVFETDFVSGRTNIVPSRATPPGIFGLTYKTRNATLRGADYESFVNYWMPFYGNYGMHDATWRRDFGGAIFQDHGSHGCINLPLASAEVIYGYVSTGFPVICYYYEVDPLGPPAENQMPSEEELRMQEEPTIGQGAEAGQGTEGVPENTDSQGI